MTDMNIYHDLQAITEVALHNAKDHNCNYNIILKNPDKQGNFSMENGSTYEFVADSYFEKERPNVILLAKTDDLLAEENIVEDLKDDPFDTRPRFIVENQYLDEIKEISRSMGMPIRTRTQPYVRDKKIGRNEPCPCGSGKKYKKCCG